MPPKKDFAAFLKKNQKKGSKATKTEEVTDAQAAEVKAEAKDEVKNTPATKKQNDNSSDEEEDELELATK
jgi:hypothetical protein